MRRIVLLFMMYALLLLPASTDLAEGNMGVTGEEFLNRLANVFFRVPYGFGNKQVQDAERRDDSIVLSYNSAIFLVVKETPLPREVESVSVVYIPQEEQVARGSIMGYAPSDDVVFEGICKQVVFALQPELKDSAAQKVLDELGIKGEVLDGLQRGVRSGAYRYILRYNENGMLIMVASSL